MLSPAFTADYLLYKIALNLLAFITIIHIETYMHCSLSQRHRRTHNLKSKLYISIGWKRWLPRQIKLVVTLLTEKHVKYSWLVVGYIFNPGTRKQRQVDL